MNWMMGSGIELLGFSNGWDISNVEIFPRIRAGLDCDSLDVRAGILSSSNLQHSPRLYRGPRSLAMIRASHFGGIMKPGERLQMVEDIPDYLSDLFRMEREEKKRFGSLLTTLRYFRRYLIDSGSGFAFPFPLIRGL
jgi:hypothetical protein